MKAEASHELQEFENPYELVLWHRNADLSGKNTIDWEVTS